MESENPKENKSNTILNHFKGFFKCLFSVCFFKQIELSYSAGIKYVKSSLLSIVVLAIMFFLLTKMEQAAAMVVDLLEEDWKSLLFAIIFVNALAFSLSHFPIYTYYAAQLNKSSKAFKWHERKIFGFIKVNVFELLERKEKYKFDLRANIFRYLSGFLVFFVWNYIIFYGFKVNLNFDGQNVGFLESIVALISILTFVLYGFIKHQKNHIKESEIAINLGEKPYFENPSVINDKLNDKLTKSLFYVTILSLMALVWVLYLSGGYETSAFSKLGLLLMLVLNYLCLILYFNFRLIRPELKKISERYKSIGKSNIITWYIRRLSILSQSKNYIALLYLIFVFAILLIAESHIAIYCNWEISNGIPILFANLYFYSFIIASVFKFYFVTHKSLEKCYDDPNYTSKKVFKRRVGAFLLFLLFLSHQFGGSTESVTHQLKQINNEDLSTFKTDENLIYDIKHKNDSVVFFIATQGGGLKANFWTMNILNRLQTLTDGKLIQQTVAMSGASGGSLALGLYTALYKEHQNDTKKIHDKIHDISRHNFTSLDLTMLFGWDFVREFLPLNLWAGSRNRSYYAQLKYENIIEGTNGSNLSDESYRSFWKGAYDINGYYPSLIMNTSSTKGNRGIFWSHFSTDFNGVFPFSENLADLKGDKTIPFYQAISTTNRFPLFSPAAKIKGYGNYIDAGAIDNGGLLGCLDVYDYLERNDAFKGKKVVFIEIVNGKSNYVRHLLRGFVDSLAQKGDYITYNENESSTISADIQTGLNLDKWPEYLSDYMRSWSAREEGVAYIELKLPHRIDISDVEKVLNGKIENKELRCELKKYLEVENNKIREYIDTVNIDFTSPWKYLEPALARHLSHSNVKFGHSAINNDKLLNAQFLEVKRLTNLKKIKL